MLDVHALRVFYEAARTGSFTAAARVLNITQPAVSMQIKTLEDYLQVQLFERNGRHIRLTKVGQALMPQAEQIIHLVMHTEENIRTANSQVVGNLVIGCSVPSAHQVLIHLVSRFQQIYPNVQIALPTVSRDELTDRLTSGEYDFGVMNLVSRCDNVECKPFFSDQVVLIAPATHPFAKERDIEPKALLGERFVCQDRHSACRYAVGNALEPFGINVDDFDIAIEVGSPHAIIAAVEHGIGLSFVSQLEAAPRLALGQLSIVEIRGMQLSTPVHMAHSSAHIASPVRLKFQAFMEHPQTIAQIRLLTQGAVSYA